MPSARTWTCAALVLAGGLLAAFFVTFNSLFTDGPRLLLSTERVSTYVISFMTHAILGVMGPMWARGNWPTWAGLAAGPSIAVAIPYGLLEPNVMAFAVLYASMAGLGALFGAFGGSRFTRPST